MSIVLVGSTSGSVTLQEPAVAGTTVLDLPATSGTILTTASTGISASNITTGTLPYAQLPVGTVLQVVSTLKNDTFSTTSTSFVDVTGLSLSITPRFATSKILILVSTWLGVASSARTGVRLMRDSTAIGVGTGGTYNVSGYNADWASGAGDNLGCTSVSFLDSPATTSATTYKIQQFVTTGTGYVNRRGNDTTFVTGSTITALEIDA
jgi:hypothetical protein